MLNIPHSPAEVTPEWLNEALQPDRIFNKETMIAIRSGSVDRRRF